MVFQLPSRAETRVRDHYFGVLDAVMGESGIGPAPEQPGVDILPGTGFMDVVQYTDWYCRRRDSRPHYRYDRYLEVLGQSSLTGQRMAHIDIGCGAGTFGWAFLDWAIGNGFAGDSIDLYGLDHSPAMIDLAEQIWVGLLDYIPDAPGLHYADKANDLLAKLSADHRPGTNYKITFGHALIQAHMHTPGAILNFTQAIKSIVELKDSESLCSLIAVDARGGAAQLARAWDALMDSLRNAGVRPQQRQVRETRSNSGADAKIAGLALA